MAPTKYYDVADDLVRHKDLLSFEEALRRGEYPWAYYTKSDHNTDVESFYWGSNILLADTGQYGGLSEKGAPKIAHTLEDLGSDHLVTRIWQQIAAHYAPSRFQLRGIFLNGQSHGQDGEIHLDSERAGTAYTFVVYLNRMWEAGWQGETVLYNDERNEIIASIIPYPGRVLVFDGSIPHWGRAPAKVFPGLRVTLAYHTLLEEGSPSPDAA